MVPGGGTILLGGMQPDCLARYEESQGRDLFRDVGSRDNAMLGSSCNWSWPARKAVVGGIGGWARHDSTLMRRQYPFPVCKRTGGYLHDMTSNLLYRAFGERRGGESCDSLIR